MKLDDEWRKSFESFLHFMDCQTSGSRRIWPTDTLSSQPDIETGIHQEITTELIINGTHASSTTVAFPWINFYNMVLSNTKWIDSTRSNQTGRCQDTHQANRNNNNTTRDNNKGKGKILIQHVQRVPLLIPLLLNGRAPTWT
jgi:hypothetical protein